MTRAQPARRYTKSAERILYNSQIDAIAHPVSSNRKILATAVFITLFLFKIRNPLEKAGENASVSPYLSPEWLRP
jgi:hypothetical protein